MKIIVNKSSVPVGDAVGGKETGVLEGIGDGRGVGSGLGRGVAGATDGLLAAVGRIVAMAGASVVELSEGLDVDGVGH